MYLLVQQVLARIVIIIYHRLCASHSIAFFRALPKLCLHLQARVWLLVIKARLASVQNHVGLPCSDTEVEQPFQGHIVGHSCIPYIL